MGVPHGGRLRRSLRSYGGRLLRRLGLLPEGVPDGLGQDEALLGTRRTERVVVYYPGTVRNLYQLRQWYAPLAALDASHRVLVVVADSRVGRIVAKEVALPCIVVARLATLDDVVSRSDVAMFCYVGHEQGNFTALRMHRALHVYLSHGESDKLIAASNQVKAYDYVFVAGQGAVDRYANRLMHYDAATRCVPIGRPQLDGIDHGPRERAAGESVRVLYAPTWEGAQATSAYSSVETHGYLLVQALLADGRFTMTYRPHPRTGANRVAAERADAALRRLVAAAGGTGRVDDGDPLHEAFAQADMLVTDVSAIALDWLVTGRPLVVTVPAEGAVVAQTKLLDVVPRLDVSGVGTVGDLLWREVLDDPGSDARAELARYYFGDPAQGSATERFVKACGLVVAERDRLQAEQGEP